MAKPKANKSAMYFISSHCHMLLSMAPFITGNEFDTFALVHHYQPFNSSIIHYQLLSSFPPFVF